jgi:hypothetical protein
MTELKILLKEIEDLAWANKYLDYIRLLNIGMRKQARSSLIEFFSVYNLQSKDKKRNFINTINILSFITNKSDIYLPYDLYNNIFLPEIESWIYDEPLNPIPYKRSNKFENNRKSLELDPKDKITIEKITNYIIGKISMNQHELQYGYSYDGEPKNDILLIDYIIPFLKNIEDTFKRKSTTKVLEELKFSASLFIKQS